MTTTNKSLDEDMPSELDFTKLGKSVRGLHYLGPNVTITLPPEPAPLYLDQEVQAWLTAKAVDKGVSPETIANELLKRQIETIEAMK